MTKTGKLCRLLTGRRVLGIVGLVAAVALALAWQDGAKVSAGDEKPAAQALPADLDVVPRDAAGFATARVADLWNSEAVKAARGQLAKVDPKQLEQLEKMVGIDPANVERATIAMPQLPNPGDQGAAVIVSVLTIKPYDKAKLLQALLPGAAEENHAGKTIHVAGPLAFHALDERTFLIGLPKEVRAAIDRAKEKKADGPLSEALALATGKHHVVAAGNPEPVDRMLAVFNPPELEPFQPLLKAKVVVYTLNIGTETKMTGRLTFENEDRAKAGLKALNDALEMARGQLPMASEEIAKELKDTPKLLEIYKTAEAAFKTMPVEHKGRDVQLAINLKVDPAELGVMTLEAVNKVRTSALRMTSVNNLKQIALAMHNYHDTMGTFPPHAIYSKDGKPLLSWRVMILPYVEQDNLYQQFRLDEPWDSEHNKKLVAQMPKLYAPVVGATKEPGMTYYRAFHGKGAFFEGIKGLRILEFLDGTSNTIMVVEAGEAVPWTKPDDLEFDAKKPLPKLGGLFKEGINAAVCDGSVRFLPRSIKEETLRALITRNGGEVVQWP